MKTNIFQQGIGPLENLLCLFLASRIFDNQLYALVPG
jgi:hypothetical protein